MIELREPKYNVGDKVVEVKDQSGDVFTVKFVLSYFFDSGEYSYKLVCKENGIQMLASDRYLAPYIEKPKTVWDLEEGDYYAVANINGDVYETHWAGSDVEKDWRDLGNCFLTKEEAEFECERRKIETEMIRLGGRRKFNRGKDNYFIMYTRIEGLDYVNYQSMHEQGVIYFDSELDAINAVKTIGKDKIKKYIFVES